MQQGKVFDWNQYKEIAQTSNGSIVLHERFQPEFPDGNPWVSYTFSTTEGERGQHAESIPDTSKVERLDLVYLFQDGSLLSASYDGEGKLIFIQAQHDLAMSAYLPILGMDNPFAVYGIPISIRHQLDRPPLNDKLRSGIAKGVSIATTNAPLDIAFLIRQYDIGSLFEVIRRDAKNELRSTNIISFVKRPYDRHILEAAQRRQRGLTSKKHNPIKQLNEKQELSIPDGPLVVGGYAAKGGGNLLHVMVKASPEFVRAGYVKITLAHFRIEIDPKATTQFISSGGGNSGDKFVWMGNYSYIVDDAPMTISVTIDGRTKTLSVSGQIFELASGNYVNIKISANCEVTSEQIATVRLDDDYFDADEMVKFFKSHFRDP